jgi:hypothetical protein
MWSPSPFLNKLAESHGAQKSCSIRLLCPEDELPRVPEMVWDVTCNWA